MLTSWKVSSLACKCVFYRPGHNAKRAPQGIEPLRSRNAEMKSTNKQMWKIRWANVYSRGYGR